MVLQFRKASLEDITWVCELDRKTFRAADLIDHTVFEAWQNHNDESFWVAGSYAEPRAVHAYFAMLYLGKCAFAAFKAGRVAEGELAAADLLAKSEVRDAREAYLFSVVSDAPKGSAERRDLKIAVIEHILAAANHGALATVYVTTGTTDGRNVLLRAVQEGLASKVQDARERADGHSLYRFDLDPHAAKAWAALAWRAKATPLP